MNTQMAWKIGHSPFRTSQYNPWRMAWIQSCIQYSRVMTCLMPYARGFMLLLLALLEVFLFNKTVEAFTQGSYGFTDMSSCCLSHLLLPQNPVYPCSFYSALILTWTSQITFEAYIHFSETSHKTQSLKPYMEEQLHRYNNTPTDTCYNEPN